MVYSSIRMVFRLFSHTLTQHNCYDQVRLFVQIRTLTAFSSIMFVLSSNPSCSNHYRLFVHDKNNDRLLVYNTDKHRNNPIIRIINKCLKKHSIAFYCFHYINHYCYKDMILQYSQATDYQNVKYIRYNASEPTHGVFHSTFPQPCGKLCRRTPEKLAQGTVVSYYTFKCSRFLI